MSVALNHTIIHCRDKTVSAKFLAEILGLPAPKPLFGHFLAVSLDHGVTLDFCNSERPIEAQHYAFLIGEDDFDAVFKRVTGRGLDYWADPMKTQLGEIGRYRGGRGFYFHDPDGHFMEVLTRPYEGD